MEPKDTSPSRETGSSKSPAKPLSLSAHETTDEICRILSLRILDAYETFVDVSSATDPSDRWWHEAALKCCLDMLRIEYHLSAADLRQLTLDYLAEDAPPARPVDHAERIRATTAAADEMTRAPDAPLPEQSIPTPCDLPRPGPGERLESHRGAVRLPDPSFFEVKPI